MECLVNKEEFVKKLSIVQSIVERKTTLPILSYILISIEDDIIDLKATNLDVGINTIMKCKTIRKGKIAVLGKKLYEISKETPSDEIILKVSDGNYLEVKSGRSRFKVLSADPSDFPEFPDEKGDLMCTISYDDILKLIDKTIFSASVEETKYFLNGVFIERGDREMDVRFVATDGHRLSYYEAPVIEKNDRFLSKGVIIPRKGILEIRNIADEVEKNVSIYVSENYIVSQCENYTLYIRMIEGEFPNYRDVIPSEFTRKVYLDREEFLSALKRVAIISSSTKTIPVKFFIMRDKLVLSSENPEVGEADEEIDGRLEGEEIEIGFNAKYIADALDAIDAKDIVFCITNEAGPALMRSISGDDAVCIIMPMRL